LIDWLIDNFLTNFTAAEAVTIEDDVAIRIRLINSSSSSSSSSSSRSADSDAD